MRVTAEGILYEADPRHHELLMRSMGLEGGTSAVAPGVKAADSENSVFKGEENLTYGPVISSNGEIRVASTDENGHIQLSESDTISIHVA